MFILLKDLVRAAYFSLENFLRYDILRMARNAYKIFIALTRKNFIFKINDPLVGF